MTIIRNISITILISMFLQGCGYTPIYSAKNINFKIETFTVRGDAEVGKILDRKFNSYKNITNSNNVIIVVVDSQREKVELLKDKSGKVLSYKVEITTKAEAKRINSTDAFLNDSIVISAIFDNKDQTYDSDNSERKIVSDLANKIAGQLILKINQSLLN